MKPSTILLFLCFGSPLIFASAEAVKMSRLKTGRITLEEYLQQCWQEFVSSMSTGIPELNIPTFDPWFSADSFPFRMQDSSIVLRADANATSVESLGFSSVLISSVQESANSRYNVSLTLPDLDIMGIYSIVGSHHYFYPIVGNGPFALTLRNVWSTGTTTLLFDGTVYSLTKLELTPLMFSSSASEYYNLSVSGTDSTSETFISVTNSLTEMLWCQVEEQLRLQLSESITQYLNEQLLDFKPSSFINSRRTAKNIRKFEDKN